MEFNKVLIEYIYNVPLKKWNEAQKETWLDLVSKGLVVRNDTKKFTEFAKLFDLYYQKTKELPSSSEMAKELVK
jgi:hypothetical protein